MPNAAKLLIFALGVAALAACSRAAPENEAANQSMPIEGNLAAGEFPPGADIETLPPDESSEISSNELQSGADTPDVNEPSNTN